VAINALHFTPEAKHKINLPENSRILNMIDLSGKGMLKKTTANGICNLISS
jgi:hypothetical protein